MRGPVAGLLAIFATVYAGSASAVPYASAVLADNPDAYWRLNETSGTVATDSSGNARHGTYVNTPTLGQSGPLSEAGNTAVSFSAASQEYVDIQHTFGGAAWTAVTVEAWINLGAPTGNFQAIVSALGLEFVHFQAFAGGNNVVYATPTPGVLPIVSQALTGWHHVAMTATSGAQRLYLDGTLIGSDSAAFTNIVQATQIRIGSGFSGGRFFNGAIDEVAIYRSALTESQIDAHIAAANDHDRVTATPEPATLALLGAALLGLCARRSLRR